MIASIERPVANDDYYHVSPQFADVLKKAGISTASDWFAHSGIKVWRKLPDRENATLDIGDAGAPPTRFHVKRYTAVGGTTPAEKDLAGHHALVDRGIPTAELVACGVLGNRRSAVVFLDLTSHTPADKLVESGTSFEKLLAPTAQLAAKLHSAGLHHRDLYLCHFMATSGGDDVRIIDTARVKPLPRFVTRRRWIVKDLAQFWYSTLKLPVTDAQRDAWLDAYCQRTGAAFRRLRRSIIAKSNRIARHDARLVKAQPTRNISIPGT